MRLAVLADIHGNIDALQAVLADLAVQSPDLVVNLGDCLSGLLWPAETADLLMTLGWPTVRGNHDRWLTEGRSGPWEAPVLPHLTLAHHTWLAALPPVTEVAGVFLCHATPQDDLTYWLDEATPSGEMQRRPLEAITAHAIGVPHSLMLCGHTHIARAVRLTDGRMVVNPGSVGLPGYTDDAPWPHRVCAGTPHARYALLDQTPQGWAQTLRQVPYDTSRAMARARDPEWADALGTGWLPLPPS